MNWKIDDSYSVKSDANNFTLVKEQETDEVSEKTGKSVVSKDKWHYGSFKQCLLRYKEESLKTCDSVEQILSKLEELELLINSLTITKVENG